MELLEKELTAKVIGACFEVANELGNGFLESVYRKALMIALQQSGLEADEEAPLKVSFRGQIVGDFYADILVDNRLVIELKATKALTAEHDAQVMNYLKATNIKVGLLINFGKTKVEWRRLVC